MIGKELFVEVIEDAMKSDDYQNWLNQQLISKGAEGCLFQPTCVDSVIKLLHIIFAENGKKVLLQNKMERILIYHLQNYYMII